MDGGMNPVERSSRAKWSADPPQRTKQCERSAPFHFYSAAKLKRCSAAEWILK